MLVVGGPISMYILATLTGLSGIRKQSACGWEVEVVGYIERSEKEGRGWV